MRAIFSSHLEEPATVHAFQHLQSIVADWRACLMCYEADPSCCHRQVLTRRLTERVPKQVIDLVAAAA